MSKSYVFRQFNYYLAISINWQLLSKQQELLRNKNDKSNVQNNI